MEVTLADLRAGSDTFTPDCPTRVLLDHITSRWGVLILVALSSGTMRWGELRRWARGISEKMLAQTLRTLEADGLVLREQRPVVPPHVDYSLTDRGRELSALLLPLMNWIIANAPPQPAAAPSSTLDARLPGPGSVADRHCPRGDGNAVDLVVRGAREGRPHAGTRRPRAGRGVIAQDFDFRGISTANRLRKFRGNRPGGGPPGQPGRKGHARARREGGECLSQRHCMEMHTNLSQLVPRIAQAAVPHTLGESSPARQPYP